jgi:hypothetical protein
MKVLLPLLIAATLSQRLPAGEPQRPAGWKQKAFLITFWSPPPATDEALGAVAAEHYNLTWVPPEGLDAAARHGLRAMLQSDLLAPASLDDAGRKAQLDALVDRVKGHPALEAYFIVDEPSAGAFPALGRLVAYLRERDPAHLAYINLFPTYANETQLGITAEEAEREKVEVPRNLSGLDPKDRTVLAYLGHLKRYVEVVKPDLISYDHYHFFKDADTGQYFLNLALIRRAALDCGKPFLNIIQASTVEKVWRLPTATEIRWLVFTTMAYGGRGISYFTYWGPASYGGLYQDGKASPLARDVAPINAEIEKIGPALLELDSLAVYHTAPLAFRGTEAIPAGAPVSLSGAGCVLGIFGKAGQPSAFLVVNGSYKMEAEAEAKVQIPGKALQELDRKTGAWSDGPALGDGRTVKIKLAPGDGRLFRVAESPR